MSEYQYVAFRAIDGPVSETNLAFMHRQSTRAKITPWSFTNEYHFGDFHGDASEMLRRGYDVHFHYANYGIRTLMIRLPNGFPDPKAAEAYLEQDALEFIEDKQGAGGILSIQPYHEPGDLDDLWEFDELFERLLALRAEILEGDLRPLYLARLAVASDLNHDSGEKDAPVPAGLGKLTDAQKALAKLYDLKEALLAAAAQNSPPLPKARAGDEDHAAWLQRQPEATRNAWLCQLMTDPHGAVRREIIAEYQKSRKAPSWPTIQLDRTLADLRAAAETIGQDMSRKRAEAAARTRSSKLAGMAADPMKTLRETEKLVGERSTHSYGQIAELLADLREALAGTDQAGLAEQQARQLKEVNPTLHHLTSTLRRKGFLKK
jgi:hypothetical protein